MSETQNHLDDRRTWLGTLAICTAVTIYASNFVVSRYSVTTDLTPFDLVALRFLVAGVILLPLAQKMGIISLGGIGWTRGLLLSCLAGAPYMLLVFGGLHFAPASHGAALNPGFVPIVAAVAMWIVSGLRISWLKMIGLGAVVTGLVLVTSYSFIGSDRVFVGDILFLLSGLSWGIFTVLMRVWRLQPLQVAVAVSVISLAYLPPYLLFVDSGITQTPVAQILLQGFNQGILNAVVALYLFAYGVQTLGAQNASLFNSLVPVVATMLAIPFLHELPSVVQWLGIGLVVLGMIFTVKVN